MKLHAVRRLLLAAVLLALAVPAGAQSFAWWKDEQFQKEVGLTPEQCARIDAVFRAALPKLREGKAELDQLESELSNMIQVNAEEGEVVRQIDRVEAERAALNKMRTLMLLHMHQVLTPDQLVRFKAAHDEWQREHRRSSRPGTGHEPKQ
ncbi:MAG: Spy/CpxP family protein refolding chaperone [Betaproteobacteria bacterium]